MGVLDTTNIILSSTTLITHDRDLICSFDSLIHHLLSSFMVFFGSSNINFMFTTRIHPLLLSLMFFIFRVRMSW